MNAEDVMPDCLKYLKEIDPEAYHLYLDVHATNAHISNVLKKMQEDISRIQESFRDVAPL